LKVAGGMTADDKPFLQRQMKKLEKLNYLDDIDIQNGFTTGDLKGFFIH